MGLSTVLDGITNVIDAVAKTVTQVLPIVQQGQNLGSSNVPATVVVNSSGGPGATNTGIPKSAIVTADPATFSLGGGGQTGGFGLDIPGVEFGQGADVGSALTQNFVPTRSRFTGAVTGARAQNFVAINPVSGAITWFGPIGRPILWSGDVRAAKRLKKIARFAARKR